MSEKTSVWARIVRFFRPERETYETRQARGGEIGADPTPQYNQATDQRRHGGSGAIGSP
jgi:hypothetical protein